MLKGKRILVCPLDWGLGHATRCIPVIHALLEQKADVIIAADKRPLELLKKEFPSLTFIKLPGYEIRYPRHGKMVFAMLLSIPKILRGIKREHDLLEKIIDEHKIDAVISDNRYGCWSKKIKSIFITHQLMVKSPVGEKLLHKIISGYIKKYDECWIPDNEGKSNLSGDLSHKFPLTSSIYFIGPLSRFKKEDENIIEYEIMGIVSGPEPQRTIFERILSEQLFQSGHHSLIVFGLPEGKQKKEQKKNVTMVSHLDTLEMQKMMSRSKMIVARSGYSTIMDLQTLQKKVIFVPTPGQTEQEYLAKELKKKGIAFYQEQSVFDLSEALKESERYTGFIKMNVRDDRLLSERIQSLFPGNDIR